MLGKIIALCIVAFALIAYKRTIHFKMKGMWWFRTFGWGIHAKMPSLHSPLLSERNGYKKKLDIGKWSFMLLHPFEWQLTTDDDSLDW